MNELIIRLIENTEYPILEELLYHANHEDYLMIKDLG